jgi:peptidyl-prolyl cis-trans isomerase SurA
MGIAHDTGLTLEQLEASVESHGLSIEAYREKIKSEIERSKVLNTMVRSRVRVEPAEVQALYDERFATQRSSGEEMRMRAIIVGFGEQVMRNQATACNIAEDAAQKIRSGEIAFPDMARRVTDMNPQQAGELGWIHKEELAGWMAPIVAKMEPGDTSDVIETAFGCNVIQLVERRGFKPVTFEEAEPALTAELMRQKTDREYMTWLETLRKQTYVSRKGFYGEPGRIKQITGNR